MYVRETGTGAAPTIVLLHGGGVGGWMWRAQTNGLGEYHCVVPDLPGHGGSRTVPWISIADTAAHIADLIRARATDGRAHVVGLSLGAHVAITLLAHTPDLVDHVIVSGLNVLPVPRPLQTLSNALWPFATTRWMLRAQARALKIGSDVYPEYVETARSVTRDTYRRIGAEAYQFHVPPQLRDVPNPMLVVAGEKEVKLVHRSLPILLNMLPHAQGCIAPGVGHGWNGEKPDLFTTMIRAWITDAPLPTELKLWSPTGA